MSLAERMRDADPLKTIRRDQITGRIAVKTDAQFCPWMILDVEAGDIDAAPESYVLGWQVVYRPKGGAA